MAYYGKQKHLIKGELQIFTIKGSKRGVWYCIIKIGNHPRIRKSLKTTLRSDAERQAFSLYNKSRALYAEGLPMTNTSWKSLMSLYDAAKNYGNTTRHRLKMVGLFFEKIDNIRDIDATLIQRWAKWRKENEAKK